MGAPARAGEAAREHRPTRAGGGWDCSTLRRVGAGEVGLGRRWGESVPALPALALLAGLFPARSVMSPSSPGGRGVLRRGLLGSTEGGLGAFGGGETGTSAGRVAQSRRRGSAPWPPERPAAVGPLFVATSLALPLSYPTRWPLVGSLTVGRPGHAACLDRRARPVAGRGTLMRGGGGSAPPLPALRVQAGASPRGVARAQAPAASRACPACR